MGKEEQSDATSMKVGQIAGAGLKDYGKGRTAIILNGCGRSHDKSKTSAPISKFPYELYFLEEVYTEKNYCASLRIYIIGNLKMGFQDPKTYIHKKIPKIRY